ncbi:MAG TPA: polyhydroxyalkanoate depolymerase [Amaricoccus sp.]|uniref:polyhydroxyalkanoate depolymerase n=1 Tax=Amaricoccus sp. TaxID=1872485 RepID=UPI002D1CC22D|nr:polyhydroxyalkanoate depolymerase [Amaricoccus sp.]HMQ93599.1 polyhydroxyalkanoate depolymerase [Amaricoccus sp.]HMR54370.1 polyhydroxyalkanoate depolymerase [Amaricoccus sp.]HMR61157.1 polyhydroxyalkanoate depolymerase [Amaricoccus sp.]HMU01373.1 polyhydroxyalkanoate depolymerase [Amaricoccus sp.]
MLYHAYEMTHAAITPMRAAARMGQEVMRNPLNPMSETYGSRAMSAALEMFINATRRYGKPEFGIDTTLVDGVKTPVVEEVVWSKPFCKVLHFRRDSAAAEARNDPRVLMVAPMSGHYATLLRGTVEAMLPEHEVYITDWIDARDVPLTQGEFDLDDYTDYLIELTEFLSRGGERISVMAVCQPGVPAMVAASLMSMDGNPLRPASMVLMGSPIDTARNPKQPNELAKNRPLSWFENNVVVRVPWPNRGFMRRVYPGFLQLSSFLAMNIDRHLDAHVSQFQNLVRGDGDSSDQHRSFYDEYLAVMDLAAEFYLQTIERVFQKRLLAIGEYRYRDRPIDPAAMVDIGLMTIEGEKDDITGLGQTEAAHDLATGLPETARKRYVAEGVGHYGVFNGSRWRKLIQPEVRDFIRAQRRTVTA